MAAGIRWRRCLPSRGVGRSRSRRRAAAGPAEAGGRSRLQARRQAARSRAAGRAAASAAAPAAPRRRRRQQAAQQPQLIYSPWIKFCNKDADPNAKQVCVTVKDGRIESGLPVVSVAIIEPDGDQRKLLRISRAARRAAAARHAHDRRPGAAGDRAVRHLPAAGVPPNGCMADYEANADMIGTHEEGPDVLTVQAINMNGQPMSPQLAAQGFRQGL